MWPFPASRSAQQSYSTLPVAAADTDAPDHDLHSPTSTLASPPRSLSPAKDEKALQRMLRSRKSGFLHSPLLVILTSILTLVLTLSNTWVLFSLRHSDPYDSDKPLRRPSQFIGLSRLNFSSFPGEQHPPHKLITFASLVQPLHRPQSGLFSSTPEKTYHPDPRSHFTRFGTISPEDRPLYVSNPENISTILQFRARDFGLEMCRLILELPKDARYDPSKEQHMEARNEGASSKPGGPRQRNWRLSGDVSAVEIWHLTSTPSKNTPDPTLWSNFIDGYTLSSKTLPIEHRHSRLGSLTLTPAFSTEKDHTSENSIGFSQSTPWFACPADSIQTFEVFCTSPGCVMDIWQDKSKPVIGIALEQKETFM